MSAASQALKIKYGLGIEPPDASVAQWAALARQFIRDGYSREDAGERAAKQLFRDYRTHVYATEGETIDTLLRLAEGK